MRKPAERELTAVAETTSCRRPAKDRGLSRSPTNLSPPLCEKMSHPAFLVFTKSDLETCCCDAISNSHNNWLCHSRLRIPAKRHFPGRVHRSQSRAGLIMTLWVSN